MFALFPIPKIKTRMVEEFVKELDLKNVNEQKLLVHFRLHNRHLLKGELSKEDN